MYLVWLGEKSTRSEVAEVMRGPVAEGLLSLDPLRLTIDVWDPESDIPAPVPTPEGETPLHGVVSLWVDSIEQRAPFEQVLEAAAVRVAGYSVVESLYRDYGGQSVGADRSWPDGERSPGVLTVALLQQHPDQTFDEWMTRWHTRISPITERDSATDPLCPQRGVPPDHRGGTAGVGHRGGGLALAWTTSPTPCSSTVPTETLRG